VVQREWFAMSSNKLATVVQVETMLTCVRDVSQTLLEHVVNMADNNVRTYLLTYSLLQLYSLHYDVQ